MTTIVINAISVREGGSLVVLDRLLVEMVRLRPDWQWHVAVNDLAHARLAGMENTIFHVYHESKFAGWKVRFWYETALPRLVEEVNADLLFSQTNYLPWRKLPCPSLLLVQHAGHFSDLFRRLTERRLGPGGRLLWRLKGRWVKSSVSAADAVTVQTEVLANQIASGAGIARHRIRVIPHGVGLAVRQVLPATAPKAGGNFRLGYITMFGVQKNFAVLFAAMARLKRKGMPTTLVLTLSEDLPENQAVLESARQHGVADVIENHGELSPKAIADLYNSLHAFAFPSLCESFGFPLVEAMAHGLPLLIADIDSNIEVAGSAGTAFPPLDPAALASEIERLARDGDWFSQRAQASLARGAQYSWSKAAAATLSLLDELTLQRGAGVTHMKERG